MLWFITHVCRAASFPCGLLVRGSQNPSFLLKPHVLGELCDDRAKSSLLPYSLCNKYAYIISYDTLQIPTQENPFSGKNNWSRSETMNEYYVPHPRSLCVVGSHVKPSPHIFRTSAPTSTILLSPHWQPWFILQSPRAGLIHSRWFHTLPIKLILPPSTVES